MGIRVKYYINYIFLLYITVGKSCISLQFTHEFGKYEITTNIDIHTKIIELNGNKIKIQIWDLGGNEKFQEIRSTCYKGINGALLVYDITRKETFTHIKIWLEEVKTNCSKQINIILIGNKNDLEDKRQVSHEEGKIFAEENGLMFLETSAKNLNNFVEAYIKSVESILNKIKKTSSKNFNDNLKKRRNEIEFEIKLTDYGLAKNYQNNSNSEYNSIVGTNYYIAPEVYQNKGCSKSDLWSIGLILYNLYYNEMPFENLEENINRKQRY